MDRCAGGKMDRCAGEGRCVLPPVLPPEPVSCKGVLVSIRIDEGGHVPVHGLDAVQLAVAAKHVGYYSPNPYYTSF